MSARFRPGRHNPFTIYVECPSITANSVGATRAGEAFVGSLPDERLVLMAIEALNGQVCHECPWECAGCTRNSATCECYEHLR